MHDQPSDQVASPAKPSRVEDGKIRKLKAPSRSDSTAVQYFNGKTYACESCKRGHRVQKCDHGRTRPISETKQPGRPSGGQKRGCQCPRNCACTTKTCKCKRDCACTQEMYLIVRVDGPQTINREATSTPRPVWEDEDGNTMTLKKVWADANGKQIDFEEYQARQRRKQEREEGITPTPEVAKSSCCSSKRPKEEASETSSQGPSSGCRHRQNITITQSATDVRTPNASQNAAKSSNDSWVAACSCGSGCSCLYCPDHPNNETSIRHTQQQVKNLAEQAYIGEGLMPASLMPENNTRSCMGGRPSFFLSKTPGVSQQQLEQFFSQNLDPDAIYLTYPIQQHSWTNQPVSTHCSHIHSPPDVVVASPDPPEPFVEPVNDMTAQPTSWDLLPNDSAGTWNFSDGPLGNSSFSWTDLDASRGTDYRIGQATVASMATRNNAMMLATPEGHHPPNVNVNMDSVISPTHFDGLTALTAHDLDTSCCHFNLQNNYIDFDFGSRSASTIQNIQAQGTTMSSDLPHQKVCGEQTLSGLDNVTLQSLFSIQAQGLPEAGLAQQIAAGPLSSTDRSLPPWTGYDPLANDQAKPDLLGPSIPSTPPIANGI